MEDEMIYTRFGTAVDVVGKNYNTGEIEIKYPTGQTENVAIYELKADGGIAEIEDAIKNA